jgi:hypothetical protein
MKEGMERQQQQVEHVERLLDSVRGFITSFTALNVHEHEAKRVSSIRDLAPHGAIIGSAFGDYVNAVFDIAAVTFVSGPTEKAAFGRMIGEALEAFITGRTPNFFGRLHWVAFTGSVTDVDPADVVFAKADEVQVDTRLGLGQAPPPPAPSNPSDSFCFAFSPAAPPMTAPPASFASARRAVTPLRDPSATCNASQLNSPTPSVVVAAHALQQVFFTKPTAATPLQAPATPVPHASPRSTWTPPASPGFTSTPPALPSSSLSASSYPRRDLAIKTEPTRPKRRRIGVQPDSFPDTSPRPPRDSVIKIQPTKPKRRRVWTQRKQRGGNTDGKQLTTAATGTEYKLGHIYTINEVDNSNWITTSELLRVLLARPWRALVERALPFRILNIDIESPPPEFKKFVTMLKEYLITWAMARWEREFYLPQPGLSTGSSAEVIFLRAYFTGREARQRAFNQVHASLKAELSRLITVGLLPPMATSEPGLQSLGLNKVPWYPASANLLHDMAKRAARDPSRFYFVFDQSPHPFFENTYDLLFPPTEVATLPGLDADSIPDEVSLMITDELADKFRINKKFIEKSEKQWAFYQQFLIRTMEEPTKPTAVYPDITGLHFYANATGMFLHTHCVYLDRKRMQLTTKPIGTNITKKGKQKERWREQPLEDADIPKK